MTMLRASPLLRAALLADAVASGAMGVVLLAAAGGLGGPFGLDAGFLRSAGLFVAVYGAFVGFLASRRALAAALVWIVVAGNTAWVVASVAVLLSGWLAPSTLGAVFIVAQALAVGVLAELQFVGMRRAVPLAA